jgi:hypothetical protein
MRSRPDRFGYHRRVTIVSVSGACSRAGKTALAASVLAALPPKSATAVKFTTTEDVFERCPRGTTCIVCDIDVPFRIVDDPQVLNEAGTDTERLAAAGAGRVLWAIARLGAARLAWGVVKTRLGPGPVVMEGSTVVELATPDVLFFVVHPHLSPSRWKPTTPGLLARADAVVVNRPAADTRAPSDEVLREIALHRPQGGVRIADVTQPLSLWAPELHEKILHANLARA